MRLKRKRTGVAWFAAVAVVVADTSVARAQNADPAARLATATALMSMNQINQRPWHLKLDVTVFDGKGKNPSQGTIEVWHARTDERTVYTFGDASRTSLKNGEKFYMATNGPAIPFGAEELLEAVEHPGPESEDLIGSAPELRIQKFGKTPLDCIMLTHPIKGSEEIPLGLFPTYCMDANGVILATYNFGAQTVVVRGIGRFLDHEVPTQLELLNGQSAVASSKVNMLSTYTVQPEEFTPGADMEPVGNMARLEGAIVAGNILKKVVPVYPQEMKSKHLSGTVILRAIIGRDGRVHSLRPANASEPAFAISAIAAVRQWVYKPYTLSGVPTEVDTTITVNFALNPY